MQTAAYNSASYHSTSCPTIAPNAAAVRAVKPAQPSRLLRTLIRRWDLIGVVSLMLSTSTYGLFALLHLA